MKSMELDVSTSLTFRLLAMLGTPLLCMVVLWFKMDAVQQDVRKSWTITHQQFWAERLKTANVAIVVPSVDEVVNKISQQP